MNHYLLVYDREAGEICYLRRFPPAMGGRAVRHRFVLEQAFPAPRYEVVVLGADSLATARKTHGRYFLTAAELAAR